MGRPSTNKYRSYREKKTQNKKFRIYFVRVFLTIVVYSLFTVFIAISIGINDDFMSPSINKGDSIILLPTKNLNVILQRDNGSGLKRGDLVISGTNYNKNPSLMESILDPIVRIFTLQKKSLVYSNSEYKGSGEVFRIIGVPGDTIKIKESTVYIKQEGENFFLNEFELSDVDYDIIKPKYSRVWKSEFPFSAELGEVYIEDGNFFLISDNRGVFSDSRIFGVVNKNKIIGKVLLKYWPLNEFKLF